MTHGVNPTDPGEAMLREVEQDGVFPDDFYSTTNLETVVRLGGHWVPVENPEMDCGIVVVGDRARTIAVSDVKAGDRLVCGAGRREGRAAAGDRPERTAASSS